MTEHENIDIFVADILLHNLRIDVLLGDYNFVMWSHTLWSPFLRPHKKELCPWLLFLRCCHVLAPAKWVLANLISNLNVIAVNSFLEINPRLALGARFHRKLRKTPAWPRLIEYKTDLR